MKCQYLNLYRLSGLNWSVISCIANDSPYTPSISELHHYCEATKHDECPVLLKKVGAGDSSSCKEKMNQL